jgi:phytoene desaturase
MGGTGALVDGLVGLIEGRAARALRREVRRSRTGGRATGVRLADGERRSPPTSWCRTPIRPGPTAGCCRPSRRKRWTDRKLERARYSMSLFVWYFGTRRRYEDVPHHTILLGPRYRELLDDIFERKVLADDFSLYLHRPTATDPSLAPPGCDAFYVLSPVPHLDSGTDWTTQAEPYRRDRAPAGGTAAARAGAAIVTSRVMTPLDFRDRLLSPRAPPSASSRC